MRASLASGNRKNSRCVREISTSAPAWYAGVLGVTFDGEACCGETADRGLSTRNPLHLVTMREHYMMQLSIIIAKGTLSSDCISPRLSK